VRIAADTSLGLPHLDTIFCLLGISREDVEAADAENLALADDRPDPRPRRGQPSAD
jgi:phosphoserine phosphatase